MRPHEGNGSLEDRRLQIAVAGGSIGGLCAGLALPGSGFDVNVYERHPGPMDTRGAGIVVQGELVHHGDNAQSLKGEKKAASAVGGSPHWARALGASAPRRNRRGHLVTDFVLRTP